MTATAEQIHRAEEAKHLLANDVLAEALTAIRMDALLALADADPDDKTSILRQQAIVAVTGDMPQMLKRAILLTGEHDGGVTA